MGFEKLDYVMAVAEEQNLTKAAKRLFISQPALTAALNKLEKELGVTLFERKRPPVKLTQAGAFYIKEMARIRQMQMNMQTRLDALSHPQFRLSIGRGRGFYWLPILLPAFRCLHPEIRVSIINRGFGSYESSFLGDATDMAIGTMSMSSQDVSEEMLVKENLIYVIPRCLNIISEKDYEGHSLEHPLVIEASLLEGQPFVCAESGSSYPHFMEAEMNQYHFHYGELMIYDTPQASLSLAASGMGIAFISQNLCQWENIESKYQVFFCTLKEHPPTQSIRIFYPTNSTFLHLIHDMTRLCRERVLSELY